MSDIVLDIEDRTFEATLLPEEAPASVDRFRELLSLQTTVKHVRWSGYAVFVEEFGEGAPELTDLPRENHRVYPSRGDILLYPGYENVPEILIACGSTAFRSPAGELAGNHIAIVEDAREELAGLEVDVLENGSKPITIREA